MEKRRPAATKERVIMTALGMFLEKGYDGTSMAAISARAGVTKGGIYHHFDGKEDLFRRALSYITGQMEEWSKARFSSVRTAEDLLRALFGSLESMRDAFAGIVGEDTGRHPYTFLEVLINAARRDESIRLEMQTVYSRTREEMEAVLLHAQERGEIRSDLDCGALALEINALMEGVLLLSVLDASIDLDTAGQGLYANLCKMIKA